MLAILCDFDGTIVNLDTAEFLLNKFVHEDWKKFDEQLEKGEITLQECMEKQYSLLKAPKAVMLKELEKGIFFRSNFDKLVEYCRAQNFPFVIVSAGLDFAIKHFLEQKGLEEVIKIHAAKTKFTSDGITLSFPRLYAKTSANFKDDLVKYYKKQKYHVIYIGDGISDYTAVRKADFSFVIKDSSLATLCKREELQCQEITDFQEAIDKIKTFGVL
ncbi:MAG: MtnX-like HAD-IB family phosphatase [Candidatus Hermodarchaeota archaeon]